MDKYLTTAAKTVITLILYGQIVLMFHHDLKFGGIGSWEGEGGNVNKDHSPSSEIFRLIVINLLLSFSTFQCLRPNINFNIEKIF